MRIRWELVAGVMLAGCTKSAPKAPPKPTFTTVQIESTRRYAEIEAEDPSAPPMNPRTEVARPKEGSDLLKVTADVSYSKCGGGDELGPAFHDADPKVSATDALFAGTDKMEKLVGPTVYFAPPFASLALPDGTKIHPVGGSSGQDAEAGKIAFGLRGYSSKACTLGPDGKTAPEKVIVVFEVPKTIEDTKLTFHYRDAELPLPGGPK